MAVKFLLVLCAFALLVQSILASSCGCGQRSQSAAAGAIASAGLAAANFGRRGYAASAYAPAAIYSGPAYAAKSGGAFVVSVVSPIAPTGITVLSENSIDGALEVAGSLPVLAGVSFEGTVPSAGSAGTAYSCGSGDVGIAYESLAANGVGTERVAAKNYARAELAGAEWAARGSARLARPSCGCY